MIKINEIFYSIQGESTWVGLPTVFVRTSGCHLRCTYCDTTYAYYDGQKQNLDQIISKINSFDCKRVCLTGGEPLLQEGSFELMQTLCDLGFSVSVETSGDISTEKVDSRVKKIIDVKTPDSGEPDRFDRSNLLDNHPETEFKFVICSEKDFVWAEKFCSDNNLFSRFSVLYSPSYGVVSPQWLAEKILLAKSPARLQLQLHKFIWSPDQKGV